MPRKPRQHELSRITDELQSVIEKYAELFDEYLGSGLMPLERYATEDELVAAWQNLSMEQFAQMVQQSPSEFLRYWNQMDKILARRAQSGQLPSPGNPLTPYTAPYGMAPTPMPVPPQTPAQMAPETTGAPKTEVL